MWAWLQNNIGTIVVGAVVVCILAAVIVRMVKNKKQGKSSCGCGCANCAMNGQCHSNSKK